MRACISPIAALLIALATSRSLAAQTTAPSGRPLAIPLRDGTVLDADIWMPTDSGKHPVLLVRTAYLKTAFKMNEWAQYFASRGYVFVVQNVRGRGKSQGTFQAFSGEERDGFDTIEWLASQPWSTGRIGTLGVSYLGVAQWFAARAHPPHLRVHGSHRLAGSLVRRDSVRGRRLRSGIRTRLGR